MNEKLNKKLAEWAGFKTGTKGSFTYGYWKYPNDNNLKVALPNFTESLDACFKWLVPEVYKRYGQGVTQALLKVWAVYISSGAYWGKEALALCLAIEKLIDSEQVSANR